MRPRRLIGLSVGAILGLGCASCSSPQSGGQTLLGMDQWDPVAERLMAPHRMAVLYWPAVEECGLPEIRFARALGELGERFPDMEILTVVPDGTDRKGRYGVPFPGAVVSLDRAAYERRQRTLGPLPRIEVWSGAGELLLLRSIPALAAQADLLAEEIEWSRAFTRPVEEGAGRPSDRGSAGGGRR